MSPTHINVEKRDAMINTLQKRKKTGTKTEHKLKLDTKNKLVLEYLIQYLTGSK